MSDLNKKDSLQVSTSSAGDPMASGSEWIYNFRKIEKEWQQKWKDSEIYKVSNSSTKPKYYVLDMFPYPSGAGLHVGHPLGYIASDIYARYKRLKGFNVLHPMGYDSFGLPAEQYALETGQHPAVTTENNINTFRSQLDNIGFSFDWSREVRTSDPKFYKWTQWIFLQLFNSYFCNTEKKALPISNLIKKYETKGAIPKSGPSIPGKHFTAQQWNAYSEKEKQDILMNRRLAYLAYGEVNWCEALGTVLANDEVINGVSERGGYPVEKKKMRQWYLRITAYAERLLQGLEKVDFSESMKEMQRNWIGKSEGAEVVFSLTPGASPVGEGKTGLSNNFFRTTDKKKWPILKDLSRENRKNKTEAEDILWQEVRNNQLGYKVRRQHVIEGFIIDFAFLQNKLLIEIDGGYHDDEEQKKYDEARTAFLKESGYTVLRFTNQEVLTGKEETLKKIKEELSVVQTEAATPLSERRGVGGEAKKLKIYTTRPDTIFGVDFMVLAPEHELVSQITTPAQQEEIDKYLDYVKSRSERERLAEVKQITGAFTGAYALNPFDGREIPIWISEYVLAGYGTGAIMAVPCGDQRDFNFAKHFSIPITNIIGEHFIGEEANPTKDAILTNSGFLNGLVMKDAISVVNDKLEELGIGKRKINYKMRDAGFSRQRYWGEPFPIIYKDGIAYPVDEKELPVELPHVENYKPGPEGEGPLANIEEWVDLGDGVKRETNTMPGYAGSSWYFLRYMDPHNEKEFADKKVTDYWNQVDVYVGGTEHAVGHLLYSRLWTKVLFDLDYISFDEPYRKLVNQGMIQGSSRFVYRVSWVGLGSTRYFEKESLPAIFLSKSLVDAIDLDDKKTIDDILSNLMEVLRKGNPSYEFNYSTIRYDQLHVDVNIVDGIELGINEFRKLKNGEYSNATFILEDGKFLFEGQDFSRDNSKYICGVEIEKMSKSKYNTVNPNDLIDKYGADTFRMYEMFLGPVEASKPWDTKGIEGVHRFLKKLWRLFYDEQKGKIWNEEKAADAELKVLHKTIKKIEEDTERFSYNTAVSAFMVCVNELADLKCHKKEILEQLLILLAPYAPHISEELWAALGNNYSVLDATYPTFNPKYLVEAEVEYPVSINGKMRTTLKVASGAEQPEVEKIVLSNEVVQKWLEGKSPKKIIFVKNRMVNVVV
jgi:leucyl-tRNA synthetase